MKELLPFLIVGILVLSGLGVVAIPDYKTNNVKNIKESFGVSQPTIIEAGQYAVVNLEEATSYLLQVGKPVLPVITRVFTFPFGSTINNIDVRFSEVKELVLSKEVQPAPEPSQISTETKVTKESVKDQLVYGSAELYPSTRYSYTLRAGLNSEEHVIYLIVRCYPIRYSPAQNTLYYSERININIISEASATPTVFGDEYDLVIIAPQEFSAALQPLLVHKNSHGVETILKTTEEIYAEYSGRDEAEQIKYFIKDAIETLGVAYVLLVGSIYRLPIRTSHVVLWDSWQHETLTDLYYSDIYNSEEMFCSWDTNNNDKFGETGEDQLDLFPDIHIGRLACDTTEEVNVVVDKIIHYETETFGQEWFHDMIFVGGNTFRWNPGNEGEEINEIVMDIMSDFEPTLIWTSQGNFNRRTINNAINQGAGFLDYSGHGFEHGMGTYPPLGRRLKHYFTPYVNDLVNGYRLPIIFFDACLTAKLDFVLQDFLDYDKTKIFSILALLLNVDASMKLPCFAWYFVKHEGGGAIATIGATRTAFGGIESGAGKISIEFFKSYSNSEKLGQMMTKAQNTYITDVPDDEFTVEEFILLGDPTLRIGGYP